MNLRADSDVAASRVEIFNVAGRRVGALRLRDGFGSWEAGDLAAGIYLARIMEARGSQTLKMLKLR